MAVMVWLPALRVEVLTDATPLPFTIPAPTATAPSLNVTVPPGAPAPGAFTPTVAESVTVCPTVGVPLSAGVPALVAARFTASVSAPVDPATFASPLYTAVIGWLPTAMGSAGENCAWFPFSGIAAPLSGAPLSKKFTVPVAPAVTVAVYVTPCPYTAGLVLAETLTLDAPWPIVSASAPERP